MTASPAPVSPAPKLFIATTTADGIVLSAYVDALAQLLTRLHARGIATMFRTLDGRNIGAQRDRIVEGFLATDCTHLLFVDSDMVFAPDLAERLLAFDKDVIGPVYTKRALDVGRLLETVERSPAMPFEHALARTYSWNVRYRDEGVVVRGGLCRVAGLGGGFLLIRRSCFARLAAQGNVPRYAAEDGAPGRYGYFSEMREDERILDTDYAFCRRWIESGGEIWAYVDAEIRHVGDYAHAVPFLSHLWALTADREARGGPLPAGEPAGAPGP